jgi:four helix bundle protein
MMATRARGYQDLIAWQKAFSLAARCLDVADTLAPRSAALAEQIRRSSVSVAANIAEGNGRLSLGDYLRHLRIAHGSLMELETELLLVCTRHEVDAPNIRRTIDDAAEAGRVLGGLIRSLERLKHRRAERKKAPESDRLQRRTP